MSSLAEEASDAYKDVAEVVEVAQKGGYFPQSGPSSALGVSKDRYKVGER